MSDANTRTEHGTAPESKSLSYRELRELAIERRAAKHGVSRRDFVRAGTVAAIAAATSRDGSAGQTKPREAFDQCIAALKEGAGPTMSLTPAADAGLQKYGPPKFTPSNMPIWEKQKDKVLAASRAIGALSAVLAEDKKMDYGHVKQAISIVKGICGVRKNDEKGRFCPDLP